MKTLILILFCFVIEINGQSHFKAVPSTGLPYNVIIEKVLINNTEISLGSEIGIFDDTLCVGSGVISNTSAIPITCWQGSPSYGLEGFNAGNIMTFKIWTYWSGDSLEIAMYPAFSIGDGTFGYGVYSVADLSVQITSVLEIEKKTKSIFLDAYPNPFNGEINIVIQNPDSPTGNILHVYSVAGELIYSFPEFNSLSEQSLFVWRGRDNQGNKVASGIYFLVNTNSGNIVSKPIIYMK